MSLLPSRRDFLQVSAVVAGSLFFPKNLFARNPGHSFYFIQVDSQDSWPVADPVRWSLDNAREPVLERARERLLKLTPDDGERIIRLVVRRCHLNLLELQPGTVEVHHWGPQKLADLRPFFKSHELARSEVEVVVRDRKGEKSVTKTGDDFLFGDRLTSDFPLEHYLSKWQRRFDLEPDDWTAAPGTLSGFAWEGIESDCIPWSALKSAWRRTSPMLCPNCDEPTLLTNFGFRSMFNHLPNFVHACGHCRRTLMDESIKGVAGWMAVNLDAEVWPGFEMRWGFRVKREARA